MPARPLDNFPLLRSRNIEEVCEVIARVYVKPRSVAAPSIEVLNTTFNNCQLRNIDLSYVRYGTAIEFEFPGSNFFSQLFPIRGKGEIALGQDSIALTVGSGAVISPNVEHLAKYGPDYEHFVLRINANALTEKLAALTGTAISEPLRMHARQDRKQPAAQLLHQYLPLLVDMLSETDPPFPDWWIAQTEQFLMTLFLCGHQHNYSHLLEDDRLSAAPPEVRMVEEYIEANLHQEITLDKLAGIAGVSVFSLFSAFKKYRGYSPLKFLSQARSRDRGPVR